MTIEEFTEWYAKFAETVTDPEEFWTEIGVPTEFVEALAKIYGVVSTGFVMTGVQLGFALCEKRIQEVKESMMVNGRIH